MAKIFYQCCIQQLDDCPYFEWFGRLEKHVNNYKLLKDTLIKEFPQAVGSAA